MADVRACRNCLAWGRVDRRALADVACGLCVVPADDPGCAERLCEAQAAARQVALIRTGCSPRCRARTRTRTEAINGRSCRPLRAAAIFAPLSSRTAAPTTTSNHKVARKPRVPKAAIIASILLGAPNPTGPDLFQVGYE